MISESSRRSLWRLGLIPALVLVALGTVVARPPAVAHAATSLQDQLDNDVGNAVTSTASTSDPSRAAQGADDFIVPASTTWVLSEVDICGVDTGANPSAFNVFIYQDNGSGKPGNPVSSGSTTNFARSTSTVCSGFQGTGEYLYQITVANMSAPAGHDWISVQADSSSYLWYWEYRSVVSNTQSKWENPGGGFGLGCTSWSSVFPCYVCLCDFMFQLLGTPVASPSITKAFAAAAISPGSTTSLIFTISNPDLTTLTGVSFADTLPGGLVVANPNGLSGSCGGTVTAIPGSTTVSLSGGTIAPLSSCTVTVTIIALTTGSFTNCVTLTSNMGAGNTSCASVTAAFPPMIAKKFAYAAIGVGYPVPLTFTLTNANPNVTLTGLSFLDVLPGGMVVSTPGYLSNFCGGTVTAVSGSGFISLSGATLAPGANCTISVHVTGTSFGSKVNVTGPITASNAPAGNQAVATIWI